MSAVRVYNPKQVTLIVAGLPITNVDEDEFCTVDYNEDGSSLMIGADGEGAVSMSNDMSGKFTFKVAGTSEANDILMGVYAAFKLAKKFVPVLVKDNNGRSLHVAALARPVKIPKQGYGKSKAPVEWVFETHELISFVGGNAFGSA